MFAKIGAPNSSKKYRGQIKMLAPYDVSKVKIN